jgi:hypothetical protein
MANKKKGLLVVVGKKEWDFGGFHFSLPRKKKRVDAI